MADQFFFNGQVYTTPAVVSAVNDSALQPQNQGTGNALALVGIALGGAPNVPIKFTNPNQVIAALVGGELCQACIKAFAPSNDTNGPAAVYAVPVGESTQAALALNDLNANNIINLLSNQYGVTANGISVLISSGSIQGRKVTVTQGLATYIADNIYNSCLAMQYTGAGASATATLNGVSLVLSVAGVVVTTLPLATYSTCLALANAISTIPGFTATVTPGSAQLATLNNLDYFNNKDVKTAVWVLTSNIQALVSWFNSAQCPLLTAVRNVGNGAQPAIMPLPAYMAGATTPAPSNNDWASAINALQAVDVQHITPLSGSAAVWAMMDAHVQYMSTVGAMERHAYVGAAVGTTEAQISLLPLGLNSNRTAICWPGNYDFDQNGVLTLWAGYMSAALVAAGFAGSSPGVPMTNKSLTVQGLEFPANIPGDTDFLILAGVMPIAKTATGYRVMRSISTWLTDNKFDKVEISCGVATDYAMRSLRNVVSPQKGQPANLALLSQGLSLLETQLNFLATAAPSGPGVLVGDTNSPAWLGLQGTIVGDAITYDWQMSPVIPANFIAGVANTTPYAGTATVAASS